jgi:uncharacterized protein YgiM (DUF1202 family)
MFRLLALLCAGIFLAMVIGGQDRGQLRFGLMAESDETAIAVPVIARDAAEKAVVEAAFVPEKPVMVQPAAVESVVEAVAEIAPVAPAAPLDAKVMFVAAASANVREGPGKDHAVIGRLTEGEAVLVVVEGEGPEGWTLIRIEGDGLEGYIASRLLTE